MHSRKKEAITTDGRWKATIDAAITPVEVLRCVLDAYNNGWLGTDAYYKDLVASLMTGVERILQQDHKGGENGK